MYKYIYINIYIYILATAENKTKFSLGTLPSKVSAFSKNISAKYIQKVDIYTHRIKTVLNFFPRRLLKY